MLELLKSVLDELKRDPVGTGYCMCGSPVDSHGLGDGHGPVDEGQYVRNRVIEQVEAEIERLGRPVADAGGVTEDDVIGLINAVTDLAEVDALDKAYPEVWGRLEALVKRAVTENASDNNRG